MRPTAQDLLGRPVDLLDPALHASGRAADELDALRRRAPVIWQPTRAGGIWCALSHAAALEVLSDPARFCSRLGTRVGVRRPPDALRPLHNLDPPEHRPLRRLAASPSARRARSLTDRAPDAPPDPPIHGSMGEPIDASDNRPAEAPPPSSALHAALIARVDRCLELGQCDLAGDLAPWIGAAFVGAWLGLPASKWPDLLALTRQSHHAGARRLDAPPDDHPHRAQRLQAAADAKDALYRFFDAELRAASAGALALWAAADATPWAERVGLCALTAEAGLQTTADALCAAALRLLQRPELRAHLGDPRARATLIQESLRICPPILHFSRVVDVDTALGGLRLRRGAQIAVWFEAANRDEAVFESPERFDPLRSPNPHLSFGAGPHRCLGAQVADEALSVGLTALAPALEVMVIDGEVERRLSSFTAGWTRLRLRSERR